MRKMISLLLGVLLVLSLVGCGANQDDVQQLAQIKVYSGDGTLIRDITDRDTLQRYSGVGLSDFSAGAGSGEESETEGLRVLYTIVSYKEPVAAINDGELEKLTEVTVYESSNLLRMRAAQEAVKAAYIPEEYLTFCLAISDEEREFLLSLPEIQPA